MSNFHAIVKRVRAEMVLGVKCHGVLYGRICYLSTGLRLIFLFLLRTYEEIKLILSPVSCLLV